MPFVRALLLMLAVTVPVAMVSALIERTAALRAHDLQVRGRVELLRGLVDRELASWDAAAVDDAALEGRAARLARSLEALTATSGAAPGWLEVRPGAPADAGTLVRSVCAANGKCAHLVFVSPGAPGVRASMVLVNLGVALAMAALGALGLVWRYAGPLARITEAAARVRAGDLTARAGGARGPGATEAEAADRAREAARGSTPHALSTFDGMLAELEAAQRKLARSERRAAWQDMAQRVAHEIKNPLSPIQLSVETLQRAKRKGAPGFDALFEESTRTILEEVSRIRRIVTEFSDFARLPKPVAEPVVAEEVLSHVATLLGAQGEAGQTEAGAQRVRVRSGPERLVVSADRGQLVQAVLNLGKNALEAATAHRGGLAQVELSVRREGERVEIVVDDNGPGVGAGDEARVFDPDFTTKVTGMGLGLAVVLRIAEEHGGTVRVERSPLGGARFVFVCGPGPSPDRLQTTLGA